MQLQDVKKYKLPDAPGVYLFKKGKKITYIGKATSLRDRVRSYFSHDLLKTRGLRIVDMVTQANDLECITTESVLEAIILEAELIKKYQPLANIKEKDNKSNNYVVITKEEFPRVLIERGRSLDFDPKPYQAVYGPFTSQNQLREALKIIRKIFPFKMQATDSKLYQQLGLEPDVTDKEAVARYKQSIRHIKLFLQGKKKEVIKLLEKEMKAAAKDQEFERAAKIRNQIFALEHLRDVSLIREDDLLHKTAHGTGFRIEAYDAAHMSGKNSVGVMTVVENEEVQKSEYRKFILRSAGRGNDIESLEEIMTRRLKHDEWPLPDLIVIDGGIAQKNQAQKVLQALGLSIPIICVVKDDKHRPQKLLGIQSDIKEHKKAALLANSEAHRFAIEFYRKKQRKSSLGK